MKVFIILKLNYREKKDGNDKIPNINKKEKKLSNINTKQKNLTH